MRPRLAAVLIRPAVLVALVALLPTGCSAQDVTEPDRVEAELRAQQQAMSSEAQASLQRRTCAVLPASARLAGLPAVELPCLGSGPARAVSAGDGRPTVVNLWASWCAPCVREMPLLERTAQRAGSAARFVGIATQDERDSAAGLLVATGVRYDQYDDPDGTVRNAVRAVGLPVTLVFDAQGREVARRFGEVRGRWLDDALREAGVPLAPEPGAPTAGSS